MLSSNKERKNGVATFVFELFRKINQWVFAVFTNIAVQFIYKKTYFSTCKKQLT